MAKFVFLPRAKTGESPIDFNERLKEWRAAKGWLAQGDSWDRILDTDNYGDDVELRRLASFGGAQS